RGAAPAVRGAHDRAGRVHDRAARARGGGGGDRGTAGGDAGTVEGPAGLRSDDTVDEEAVGGLVALDRRVGAGAEDAVDRQDRKSTRLNSSHVSISYAVFCLKKKTKGKTSTG